VQIAGSAAVGIDGSGGGGIMVWVWCAVLLTAADWEMAECV
jgi:hypothetical protein